MAGEGCFRDQNLAEKSKKELPSRRTQTHLSYEIL